ncbi:MAG: TIGR03032 family protein [Planctomycetaceae bacterium]
MTTVFDTVARTSEPLPGGNEQDTVKREVRYHYSPALPELLQQLGVTLLVSTYQAGKLVVLSARRGEMSISFCHFDQAMGIAVDRARLAVGTTRMIHMLKAAPSIGPHIEPQGAHEGCWLPRLSFWTGNIQGHDLAWGDDGLWVVNTRFSALCTLHEDFSFVPRWQPRFITDLRAEDRCHLNGMACDHAKPRYVTALAETNEAAGWRPTKATSGVLIDVATQETIARGFAMPHSPRLYDNRLWLLNSGYGTLETVDQVSRRRDVVERMPGYTRGLAFAGRFAFVGLSRIRQTSVFGGLPIAECREQLKCGVAMIDLVGGQTVATFQFSSGVEEIFAVDVLPQATAYVEGPIFDPRSKSAEIWLAPHPNQKVAQERGGFYTRSGEISALSRVTNVSNSGD